MAAAVMALLATLAIYAGPETQGATSPSGLLVARAGSPDQSEQTSAVAQPPEGGEYKDDFLPSLSYGRRDISGQEVKAVVTPTPLPPTPTAVPPTPTPTPTPVPPMATPTPSPTPAPLQTLALPVALSELENEMWETINGERAKAGLVPLAIDGRLVDLARERTSDMITRGYFSHTTPEGRMVFDFLDSRSIYSPYAGENLARSNAEASQVVQLVLSGFMNSSPHRKNVLNSHYTHLGVGEATDLEGIRYFTLVFIGA